MRSLHAVGYTGGALAALAGVLGATAILRSPPPEPPPLPPPPLAIPDVPPPPPTVTAPPPTLPPEPPRCCACAMADGLGSAPVLRRGATYQLTVTDDVALTGATDDTTELTWTLLAIDP